MASQPDHNQRVSVSVSGKRRAELERGVTGCEHCGWSPHCSFIGRRKRGRKLPLLVLHHVVPVRYKDSYPSDIHDDKNVIVLCPNHAAIADCISGTHDNRKAKDFSRYTGPKTREELLQNLRMLDSDPDAWAATYWPMFDGADRRMNQVDPEQP